MEPLYRVVLKKAWHIVKKNPVLWIFGFFAIFLLDGGPLQVFMDTVVAISNLQSPTSTFALNLETLALFFIAPAGIGGFILQILRLTVVILVAFLLLWIIIASEISIIKSTIQLDNKEKPKFIKSLIGAKQNFFSVLGLHIISKIITFILIVGICLPLLIFVVNSSISYRLPIAFVVWVIFLPIAIIISFIFKYAINFVVLKGEKFSQSIKDAWMVFKTNWMISIEMSIWILIINLVVGFLLLLITQIVIVPFDLVALSMVGGGVREIFFTKILPIFLLYVFVGSIVTVFQISSWTLLFDRIVSGKRHSKLVRVIASMSSFMSAKNQISTIADVNKTAIETPKIVKKRRAGRPKVK